MIQRLHSPPRNKPRPPEPCQSLFLFESPTQECKGWPEVPITNPDMCESRVFISDRHILWHGCLPLG